MKNIIAILCLAAFTASAGIVPILIGSYPGDPAGEQISHGYAVKQEYNFEWCENQITNQAAQIATLQAQGQPASMVQSSTAVSLLNSNPFVFSGGSNYLGAFTNIFALTSVASTNSLTNMMSVDSGATWQAYAQTNPITQVVLTNFWTNSWVYSTPYYVTNSTNSAIIYTLSQLGTNFTTNSLVYTNQISGQVELAVLSGGTCTGSVSVVSLADPSLQGRLYQFAGESLDFSQATVTGLPTVFTNGLTAPWLLLTTIGTVTACTNLPPTGTAIGSIFATPAYLYRVIGTNANTTNWMRLAWDTNGW